ncbi:MAG: universal stress protein [Bacteroidetes bacterium]|nr:universal stress protein [Bacteroidota bacterium]MCL5026790.1 universal stress protein [Chloroflexota bacterium]
MYNRILVPLDGSALAEAALPYAIEIAKKFSSELYLFRVVSPAATAAFITPAGMMADPSMGSAVEAEILAQAQEEEVAEARRYLDQMVNKLSDTELQICTDVMEGSPATAIMHFAHKIGVDMIVLTTHGRTGLARMVMGSVADQIVRQCGCPVLLIRAT